MILLIIFFFKKSSETSFWVKLDFHRSHLNISAVIVTFYRSSFTKHFLWLAWNYLLHNNQIAFSYFSFLFLFGTNFFPSFLYFLSFLSIFQTPYEQLYSHTTGCWSFIYLPPDHESFGLSFWLSHWSCQYVFKFWRAFLQSSLILQLLYFVEFLYFEESNDSTPSVNMQ